MTSERRRFPRVKLREPLRGAAGNARIYVLDASVGGLRVAHQGTLPPVGQFVRIELMTKLGSIKVDCQIMRTTPQPPPLTQTQKPIYHSALVIIAAADRQSAERLKIFLASPPSDEEETHH